MDPVLVPIAKDVIAFGSKLADIVKSSVGALAEPTLIRRRAEAEAEAIVLRGSAEIEVRALQYETAARLMHQEMRRQQNYRAIVKIASESGPATASGEPVDPDWLNQFFLSAKMSRTRTCSPFSGKFWPARYRSPGALRGVPSRRFGTLIRRT